MPTERCGQDLGAPFCRLEYFFSHSHYFQLRDLPGLVEATELELAFRVFCPHFVLDGCMSLPVPKTF